ncbi:MAG: hypothetical protein O7G30_17665 [Proteobacteria bacterium]|nr:hypothetical protein [Pseudomonadota bacterium]
MRWRLAGLLLWCLCAGPVAAQYDPEVRALIHRGQRHNFEGDFAAADAVWARLRGLDPAAAALYEVSTLWWRISLDDRVTTYDDAIRARSQEAIRLAKARVARDPDDAVAHLYWGQALVHIGRLEGTRGNYLTAGARGEEGREHLERVLELRPDMVDAKYPVGLYYFYASTVPDVLQWLSWLWFVPSGDRETGLRYIQEVREKGDLNKLQADFIMLNIYTYHEKDDDKAVELAHDLHKRFPNSSFFHFEFLEVLYDADHYGAVAKQARLLEAHPGTSPLDDGRKSMARVWRARAELQLGRPGEAWRTLESFGLGGPDWPWWGSAWVTLTRGRILDACGDRSGALVEYDRVRSLKTPRRSKRAARNAAKAQFKPFRPRKRLVEPADGGSACSGVGRVGSLSRP